MGGRRSQPTHISFDRGVLEVRKPEQRKPRKVAIAPATGDDRTIES